MFNNICIFYIYALYIFLVLSHNYIINLIEHFKIILIGTIGDR